MTHRELVEYLTSNKWQYELDTDRWIDPRNHEPRTIKDAIELQRDRDSWKKEIAAFSAHAFDPSPLDWA